jgi:antirestriction protein
MKDFKKTISFLDAEGHRATITAEITHRNGYPEFIASGTYVGHAGQCLDEIKPTNTAQKHLIDLWKNWHLNGMNTGTPEQEAAIKEWQAVGNKYDYKAICEHLALNNLYVVEHPKTGKAYKYGEGWLVHDLPEGFDNDLKMTIEQIEAAEYLREAKKEEKTGDERILELMAEQGIDENMLDACRAFLSVTGADDLSYFNESYQGEFKDDKDFARDMAEQLGNIDKYAKWPHNCIDWEHAARELMMDYSDQDGFYFRNL